MPSRDQWPIVPLGTLAEFRNGVNYNKSNFGTGIKVIGVSDFQDHVRASFDQLEEINPEGVVRKEHLLRDGDILFVRSNGNRDLIGRSLFVNGLREKVTHSAFSIRLRFASSQCHPRFYAYLFRSSLIRQALSLYGGGTNISNLNQGILEQLQVPLPTIQTQERIASILSAYDDLIENNTRRIKILEDMAQMLYREWFVNFRFPGHEKVRMVESESGPIPDGWRIGRLEDAVVLQRGFDLPTTQRIPGDVPIIAATGLNGTHNVAKVKGPGVVTGRSGSLGTVMLVWEDFWPLNTALWAKEFRQSNPIHAYFTLQCLDLKGFNSGAAVPTLNRNDIHGLPTVLPDRETLNSFSECVQPMFTLKRNLEAKNSNLRTTRDFLLPKLISGELSVEASDEAAAELMEQTA
jgi:type I restriction enzyme S subunit